MWSKMLMVLVLVLAICGNAMAQVPNELRGHKFNQKRVNDGKWVISHSPSETLEESKLWCTRGHCSYTRVDDTLSMGGVKIEKIVYYFFKNRLMGVVVDVSLENGDAFLQMCKTKIGEPLHENKNEQGVVMVLWDDYNNRPTACFVNRSEDKDNAVTWFKITHTSRHSLATRNARQWLKKDASKNW